MKLISRIAHMVNDKHGVRVLEELELDSKESLQRRRAMGATFEILGLSGVHIDLDDRRTAFVFVVGYTMSYALARLLISD